MIDEHLSPLKGRVRLNLQTWMWSIFGCAAVMSWIRIEGSWESAISTTQGSIVAWLLSLGAGILAASSFGPAVRSRGRRCAVWAATGVVAFAAAYLASALAYLRFEPFPAFDRPFPYPDHALYALGRWYDVRHPVGARSIKSHWEIPRIMLTLRLLIMITMSSAGLLGGLLIKKPIATPTATP